MKTSEMVRAKKREDGFSEEPSSSYLSMVMFLGFHFDALFAHFH